MMIGKLFTNKILLTLFVIGIFITSPYAITAGYADDNADINTSSIPSSLSRDEAASIKPDTLFDPTTDLNTILGNNNNTYGQTWDPWLTRAAIHAVASEGDWLALASGYLYDNQIHLYRWNPEIDQYTLVWEVGGGDFMSDVLTLAFGDTNHNNLVEIIAGGEDGRFYVFEQKHIYDPDTNMENMFELVYTSERLGRIFDLVVEDVDGDYKEDIIVGTLETVRFFEYSDHSGYPFNEEHWIEFEESFSIKTTDNFVNYTGVENLYAITALEVADTNSNGLWEVVIGTRAGTVFLLENNGTVLDINGAKFPYMRDDNYKFIWNSSNSIQKPITDFAAGDLDRDGYKEIIMVVQGIGAYILDEIDGEFGTYRIQRDYAGWESDPAGAFPLDTTIDWILNSSSLESIDGSFENFNPDNFTYYGDYNVYLDYSGSNATTHGIHPEPLDTDSMNGMPEVFPYRSAMSQASDGIVTTLDASGRDAWAILDFGLHEEAAGNGINTLHDLDIKLGTYTNPQLTLSISQDGEIWYDINQTDMDWLSNSIEVEVDNVLNAHAWTYYRYIKLNVTSGVLRVDSLTTRYFNKPLYDAQSAAIGQLTLQGQSVPSTVGYIGTVDGALLAVYWNDITQDYEIVWDSWVDERYKINKNIFDLETVKRDSTFPAWIDLAAQSWAWDLTNGIKDSEHIFTYDAENFYNYRDERDVEFIVSSMEGNLHLYRQNGPNSAPAYDQFLTDILFELDLYGFLFPSLTQTFPTTVGDWMDTQRQSNIQKGLPTYFGVTVFPMDFEITKQTGEETVYDRTESGMWMFLSEWDGQIDPATRQPGDVDVSVWYLYNFPVESQDNPCYPLEECATFVPVFNNITDSIIYDSEVLHPVTLTSSEMTGQMAGILGTSQWAPKVAGYDVIGSDNQDFIVTNGKVNLLEVVDFSNPTPGVGDINTMFGDLDTMARPDYFATINNDEKGRIWTNAEPVDLDNDGDMDLMLGYARMSTSVFTLNKTQYGFTYWENQGTNEEPIWVEDIKAVANTNDDAGFAVERYTEPVLVYNDYDFGTDGFDATYGYHPVYRTDSPTDLYSFQPIDDYNLWNGTIKRFVADYTPQTSLMLATYPEARRIDINLQYEGGTAINYGYHVFETWDNDDELNGWTATVEAGHDLDGDGDQEVIVGDFNNNAYVFEHLTNNTFKRAYKSQDLNRTILTNDSPYAHEQFDGIGGTFYRTVFQHAEFVVAGVDLNDNGLKEFIMATPDMIFIFEAMLTPGNNTMQDTFELVAQIDILNHPALAGMKPSEIKITAMAPSPDANLDGRQELVVAVGSALLIFDVYKDDHAMPNIFIVQETYFSQTGSLRGQWRMPGNYYFFPQLQINALVIEDVNQNGWVDVVIGGTDTTKARQIRDGFVYLLQWDGQEWKLGAKKTAFKDTILYNPVTTLNIDDQDYDNQLELIIGHSKGVDIYEFDNEKFDFVLREVITSNPHYLLPTRSYQPGPGIGTSGGACDIAYQQRYCDTKPNFVQPQQISPMKDVLHHSSGFHMLATIGTYSGIQRLVLSFSTDNGLTWTVIPELGSGISNNLQWPFQETLSTGTFLRLESPILAESPEGDIWVGWINREVVTGGEAIFIRYMVFDWENQIWSDHMDLANDISDGTLPFQHRLYPLFGSTAGTMGYAYNLRSEDFGQPADVLFLNTATFGGSIGFNTQFPYANGTFYGSNFDIQSFDIVPLQWNSSLGQTQDYGLVFAGTLYNESLTFEDDIFYSSMTMNTSLLYNFTRPTRLASTGISEYNPSLIQEQVTGNLMVTYQAPALRPYGGLFSMWSDDQGINWQGPYDMSHPLGLDPEGLNVGVELRAYTSESGESYRTGTVLGPIYLDYFAPSHPVVAEGGTHGFTMVYSVDIGLRLPRDPKQRAYCNEPRDGYNVEDVSYSKGSALTKSRYPECSVVEIDLSRVVTAWNPHSNFSWYHLDGVTALDVGDTDDDGRREIAVASGNRAYLFEFSRNSNEMILHDEKWISKEYERDLTDISLGDINGNGFDDIVVTSDRGIVNAYSLLDTNVTRNGFTREDIVARNTPPPSNPVDPFFVLGDDFTERTRFELLDISEDGVDDVIVIDDFYIAAGNTALLRFDEEYNEVIWELNVPEYGLFLGESALQDINGDGRVELIVVFEKAIVAIDPYFGDIIWENADMNTFDDEGLLRSSVFGFIEWDGEVQTKEMVFFSEILYSGGIPTVVWNIIDIDGSTIYYDGYVGFEAPVLEVADIDGDSLDEILMVSRYDLFPLISYFLIIKPNLAGGYSDLLNTWTFYIPVTDILVGEFDTANPGVEWFYATEPLELGTFWGINWNVFPSMFVAYRWNSGANSIDYLTHDSYVGFSPFIGGTSEIEVADVTGDGFDDLIGQGAGGLFSLSTADTGYTTYADASTFSTSAVPYARNSIILADGVCDVADGKPELVTQISASSIGCYRTADFSTIGLSPVWTSTPVSFDILVDIIPGSFDLDGNSDDFMLIGKNGFVFIYDNGYDGQIVHPNTLEDEFLLEIFGIDSPAQAAVLLGSFTVLAVFTYLSRSKITAILKKLK